MAITTNTTITARKRSPSNATKPNTAILAKLNSGAIGQNFRATLHDHGGREAHIHYSVGAHTAGILDHTGHGLLAGVGLKLGVFFDLSANDVFESGEDV